MISLYAGTTPERAQETLDVSLAEIHRLRTGVEAAEFDRVVTGLKSQLIMQGESTQSRATAIAILLILVSLIGNGIGPYFVGFMSDLFMNMQLASSDFAGQLTPAMCMAKDSGITDAQRTVCEQANSTGLKQAMSVTVCWFILAAGCFFMSARTLERDFVALLEKK